MMVIVKNARYTMKYRKLLSVNVDAKTSKGDSLGYITGILYLAPADTVDGLNTCPYASVGCKAACLYTAGRGKFNNVQTARINKTILFRDNQRYFMFSLIEDIKRLIRKSNKDNKKLCIRLNGTSDIDWSKVKYQGQNIFEIFPNVQFYDYTKDIKKALNNSYNNYHITFSYSGSNRVATKKALDKGINTAIVFKQSLPNTYQGVNVLDGDKHDLRFLDAQNSIVGLIAKGEAKKIKSNFVIEL